MTIQEKIAHLRALKPTVAERQREAYIRFAAVNYPDYALTLTTERTLSAASFRVLLKKFFHRIDQELIGRHAHKANMDQRTDGVIFIEHTTTNVHAHILLKFPKREVPSKLSTLCKEQWKAVWKAGSAKLEPQYGGGGGGRYATKELTLRNHNDLEQILLIGTLVSAGSR